MERRWAASATPTCCENSRADDGRRIDAIEERVLSEQHKGVEVVVYRVHSMMPSSRLFLESFHDTGLLLADNFARACVSHGIACRHLGRPIGPFNGGAS